MRGLEPSTNTPEEPGLQAVLQDSGCFLRAYEASMRRTRKETVIAHGRGCEAAWSKSHVPGLTCSYARRTPILQVFLKNAMPQWRMVVYPLLASSASY